MRLVVLLALVAGCVKDPTVVCGELACPASSVCTAVGCASSDQVAACTAITDGEPCATPGFANGSCVMGVCLELACGDAVMITPEACDDGNQRSGDGCSADCRSTEVCGNAYADTLTGEQCDDGGFGRSGDGCSSLCKLEIPLWESTPSPALGPRASHALAADLDRDVVVLFGGSTPGSEAVAETWELDGSAWRLRTPNTSPPPLRDHAMAYDARRQRVVLFGGVTTGSLTPQAETWEWDGVEWEQIELAESPLARAGAAMAFDPDRGELVMIGGEGPARPDAWSYDGTRWQLVASDGLPSAPRPALAYDSAGRRLVYIAGSTPYVWSGTIWTALDTNPIPIRPGAPSLAPSRDGVILGIGDTTYELSGSTFADGVSLSGSVVADVKLVGDGTRVLALGGRDGGPCSPGLPCATPIDFARVLAAGSWRRLGEPPRAATDSAVVYDPHSGRVMTIAGYDMTQLEPPVVTGTDETRVWSDGAWSVLPLARTPGFVSGGAAVATPDGIVLVAGGDAAGNAITWRLDADGWTQLPVTLPHERLHPLLVYRAATDTVVLHGGLQPGVGTLNDTWELGPTGWVERPSAVRPELRDQALVAYDRRRDRMIMFGGILENFDRTSELWEWDGTEWSVRSEPGPAPRTGALGGYDTLRERFVVTGGTNRTGLLRDAWEWDGSTWAHIESPTPAPAVVTENAVGVYDELNARLLIIEDSAWHSLSFTSAISPRDVCIDVDTDGDALVACADPDCAPRCTGCGDGTCSELENRRLCAADCP